MNIRELFTAPDDEATLNEIHACGDELIEKLLDGLDDNSEASSMGGVELHHIYKKAAPETRCTQCVVPVRD